MSAAANTKELLANLRDLHKQATVERSHYYVGKIVNQSIEEIERLSALLSGYRGAMQSIRSIVDANRDFDK